MMSLILNECCGGLRYLYGLWKSVFLILGVCMISSHFIYDFLRIDDVNIMIFSPRIARHSPTIRLSFLSSKFLFPATLHPPFSLPILPPRPFTFRCQNNRTKTQAPSDPRSSRDRIDLHPTFFPRTLRPTSYAWRYRLGVYLRWKKEFL